MKKLIIAAAMLLSLGVNNSSAQTEFVRQGNTFKKVSSPKKTTKTKDTLVTNYRFETPKGDSYPIIINKNSGRCYIIRKSATKGTYYPQYMDSVLSKQICKELGITYKYIPKKK